MRAGAGAATRLTVRRRRFAAAPALLVWALAAGAATDDDLATVDRQIRDARAALADARRQEGAATRALRESETALAETEQRLAAAVAEGARLEREAAALAERQRTLVAAHAEVAAERERQWRLLHRLAVGDRLRSVLAIDAPSRLPRLLAYFEYIERARDDVEARHAAALLALDETAVALANGRAQAAAAAGQAAAERTQLDGRREARRQALARINESLKDEAERVAALTAEREELKALLARIAAERSRLEATPKPEPELPPAAAAGPPPAAGAAIAASAVASAGDAATAGNARFRSLRGRLGWPVEGHVRQRFGQPRAAGRLTWDGMLIASSAAARVHAVHAGSVVFAGWLRGFGELTIVDHGDGFLTLYGHLARSERSPGDRVRAGDVLGNVGTTGGIDEPALYFEIRSGGEPVDPSAWLRKRS